MTNHAKNDFRGRFAAAGVESILFSRHLCGVVEPALDDDEQPGKAERGPDANDHPRNRIHHKQVQERRGRGDRSKNQEGPDVADALGAVQLGRAQP
jgi:hypothetical protein